MYTEEQSTYVGYFKSPFRPHWKAGTFVWCVPFLSCPYGLLLFPHMYILFCSLVSGTEAVRECPHPVAYPLISSDYLWSWGTLCICSLIYLIVTLMRCVLYTDLSRKKGVGTKKKKRKKKIHHFWLRSEFLSLFMSSSSLLNSLMKCISVSLVHTQRAQVLLSLLGWLLTKLTEMPPGADSRTKS